MTPEENLAYHIHAAAVQCGYDVHGVVYDEGIKTFLIHVYARNDAAGELLQSWIWENVPMAVGVCVVEGVKPPALRAEAPCTTCKRMNDVGVASCWHCGGRP